MKIRTIILSFTFSNTRNTMKDAVPQLVTLLGIGYIKRTSNFLTTITSVLKQVMSSQLPYQFRKQVMSSELSHQFWKQVISSQLSLQFRKLHLRHELCSNIVSHPFAQFYANLQLNEYQLNQKEPIIIFSHLPFIFFISIDSTLDTLMYIFHPHGLQ